MVERWSPLRSCTDCSRIRELRHNLGARDAACIALAEALGCALLTGDVKLKNDAGHRATVIVTR